ncbi:MAG TPA: hypothetical protein VMU48_14980 [Terracidiphilus sp.]|nr:hypothetical protein [Terracidiphilus sp.]
MACAPIGVCIFSGTLLLVAGCGGGSVGGSGTGGGDNSTTVTFTITGGSPSAVAAKIGSGAFTAATLSSGKISLSLPSGTTTFAVAFVCPSTSLTEAGPQQTVENVVEATTLDGTSFTESCPILPGTQTSGTLTGSVDASAISGANILEVYAQNAQNGPTEFPLPVLGSSGSFSFAAPLGTDRVLVLAYDSVLSGDMESLGNLVAAKNFSSQIVPGALNGGNTVILGAADATTPEPVTYTGVPSGYSPPTALASFEINGGGAILLGSAVTSTYPALPAGAVQSGDSYVFLAAAHNISNLGEQAQVITTLASAGPVSFSFPAAWTYPGPAAAAWPSFNLAYAGFAGKTGVTDAVDETWTTDASTIDMVVVIATANSLNGSTTLAVPDLSGLAGFPAAPASGSNVVWTAVISQGSALSHAATGNGSTMLVSNAGSYVVP